MSKAEKLEWLELYVCEMEKLYENVKTYKEFLYLGEHDKINIEHTLLSMKKYIHLLKTTKKMSEIKKLVDFKKLKELYGDE